MNKIILQDCPICASKDTACIFTPGRAQIEQFKSLSEKKYSGAMDGWTEVLSLKVLRCQKCFHVWHNEVPALPELIQMYSGSSKREGAKKHELSDERRAYIRSEMGFLRASCPARRPLELLDYGSGRGHWIQGALDAGFGKVYAYDPSFERLSAAPEDARITKTNDLKDFQKTFDAINCEQVFEHVLSPVEELSALRRLASAETVLRISVPLVRGEDPAALMGTFPFKDEVVHILSPFEHLHGFSRKSFGILLERAGLKPVRPGLASGLKYPRQMGRVLLGKSNFNLVRFANP